MMVVVFIVVFILTMMMVVFILVFILTMMMVVFTVVFVVTIMMSRRSVELAHSLGYKAVKTEATGLYSRWLQKILDISFM